MKTKSTERNGHSPPEYNWPPLSLVPSAWVPYAELFRLHMPMGSLYTYFPCLFGTFLAALQSNPLPSPSRLLSVNFILLLGAFMVHGSGSTWNDILDQTIDRGTSRTRRRPIARGAVSTRQAFVFFVAQIVIGAGLVWSLLSWACVLWSMPALVGGLIYPVTKRFTNYPQVILGCVFSWGILLAFPAIDATFPNSGAPLVSIISLYVASTTWTVLYDTVYALQDLPDDLRNGVGSTAVGHAGHVKRFLGILAAIQVSALIATGVTMNFRSLYFIWICGALCAIFVIAIWNLNIRDSQNCMWWFSNQCWLVGGTMFIGLAGEYLFAFLEL